MITIHLVEHDGTALSLPARDGQSLMQVAVAAGVRGIVGECGGSAMCATCHVYVDESWLARLPPAQPPELEMLECTAAERSAQSRLGCQIRLRPEFDGLTVRLPERQQ